MDTIIGISSWGTGVLGLGEWISKFMQLPYQVKCACTLRLYSDMPYHGYQASQHVLDWFKIGLAVPEPGLDIGACPVALGK